MKLSVHVLASSNGPGSCSNFFYFNFFPPCSGNVSWMHGVRLQPNSDAGSDGENVAQELLHVSTLQSESARESIQ